VRPSARVASGGAKSPLPGADTARWARRVRGDLDWIVARAIAKDPARRYPTANAFAEDLQRFLQGRPVEAGPPTAVYQVRCFVSRHRLAVSAALLLLVSLVAGVIGTTSALADARAEARRQQRTLEATKQLLLAADPGVQKGVAFTVRELLDEFAAGLDRAFGDDPVVARDLHLTVGKLYRSLGQLEQARAHVGEALRLTRATADGSGALLERALHEWSWVLRELGRYDQAEAVIDEALALATQRTAGGLAAAAGSGEPASGGEPDQDLIRALMGKADLRRLHGDADGCEPLAQRALDLLDASAALASAGAAAAPGSAEPAAAPPSAAAPTQPDADHRGRRAAVLDLLGSVAGARGQLDRALAYYQEALELRRGRYGDGHPKLATSYVNVGDTQRRLGALDAAAAAAEAALAR
jgi:serine/threonine-protein kinase